MKRGVSVYSLSVVFLTIAALDTYVCFATGPAWSILSMAGEEAVVMVVVWPTD